MLVLDRFYAGIFDARLTREAVSRRGTSDIRGAAVSGQALTLSLSGSAMQPTGQIPEGAACLAQRGFAG
jgi:hypothetical protein